MNSKSLTLAGAMVLSTTAFAQTDISSNLVRFDGKVQSAGVYDAATQQMLPTAAARGTLGDAIYTNDATGSSFFNIITGGIVVDEGLVPRPSTMGFPGLFDSYDLSSLRFFYVTDATDPSLGGTGNSFELAIFESYNACTGPDANEAPIAVIPITGVAGSTSGGLAGFFIDVDLTGLNICMRADGRDGSANSASQRFGWSVRVTDNADATAVGPFIAGDPDNIPAGDGTVFQNPANPGTGLGTGDFFFLDQPGFTGCTFFGGYPANVFGSFGLVLRSGLSGDCVGCGLGDDNFEENDDAASATPAAIGDSFNSLVQDNDADFFSVEVAVGQTLIIDALFSDAISDLDLILRDAGGTQLDTGFTGSDNEEVMYTNCGTAPETVTVEVDNFDGNCNEYDLIFSAAPTLADDALEDNDSCAAPGMLPLGLTRDLRVIEDICAGTNDLDYYSVQLNDGDTLTVDILFDDDAADLDLFAYDNSIGCDGGTTAPETLDFGFSSTDNENIRVTNTTGATLDIIIKVDLFGSIGNTYDMIAKISSAATVGEVICAGNANSVGDGARLCATGSDVAADNALTLEIEGAPSGQFGIFFASLDVFDFEPMGSQGTLCIASLSLARFNDSVMMTSGMGTASYSPDLSSVPFEMGGMSTPLAVMAGDFLNFQFWHRDMSGPTSVSNFSDAIRVDFN